MIKRNILDCMTLVGGTPLRFEGEKTYVSTGAVDCDHVDYAQTERVTYDNRPSRANLSVAEGDILFAKMCGTKKTLRIDRPLSEHLYSTGFCAVRANESLMDAALLYHLLASDQFLTQKDQNSSGATQKAITNAGLRKIVIQVPDLPEQRKLAANLDFIEQMMANRREQLVSFDQLVKSRFIELFGDSEFNTMQWPTEKLSELCVVSSSKRIYQNEQSTEGVPFLRISDLNERIDNVKNAPELFIPINKYNELKENGLVPTEGDILVTSRGTLGRCYIVRPEDEFYFQDGMISWLSDLSHQITSLYLSQLFAMSGIQKQIASLQAGSTVAYLSISMLKKLDIMLPPLNLQNQFAVFVEQTDKSKLAVQKGLQELEILKKSLMQQYFG